MPVNIDDVLPTAMEMRRESAVNDAKKAERYAHKLVAAEVEKRAFIEGLSKPFGLSNDEKIRLAAAIIQRAVQNGLTEVQVYRFPTSLCADRGVAINRQEAGWDQTLTGVPLEIYRLWSAYLKPRGYRILYQSTDFSENAPDDISIVLSWDD